ncbi:MAG: hypothetical protein IKJ88_05595 [Clostridia bacterium]|nr:hypothetical protein [Clostridia bacterium]
MNYSEYKKHKKVNNITFILSVVLKIIIFISLIIFAVTFQTHSNISTYTIFYGRYILPPLLILLFCWEIHKIDSEKAKMFRYIASFEEIANAHEFKSSSSDPFYKEICTFYASAKVKEWVEECVKIAIRNFENDKCLSLYSLAMYEQEIKKNWDKYKGRKVITGGFALTSFSSFVFIAYPFFDDIPNDINSNNYIYSKIDEEKAKAYLIKYHQLVFRSQEKNLINQALNMINSKWVNSDNKQIEFDTGTKAILTGTLDMDATGNLTLINCEIERNDIISRMNKEFSNN